MAKPPVIEDKQVEHLIKATAAYSRVPERDTALLLTLYGTALNVTELATITVADYLDAKGSVKITSAVRVDVAHNGEARPLYWSNKRIVAAMDKYLAWRLERKQGATIKKGAYRGLDPDSPLFLTEDGQPYSLTKRTLPSGVLSYSCNTLGAYISRLHANAGIEGGSAQSARRTFAVKQHRQGRDLVHIAAILGHKSITTTKRLVDGDPVRLADIVARAV
ncbi:MULTISPECIES: site-specific integrase [unclassified Polaromonas]|jgi:site-specific recombinase XerD|uniref:tyrosine-type recombinase/integrase n=1 Tax=unclassified Polaromonas TaxID=2638319 RepID=UPI000BD024FB|nr:MULTISPECIES: site-specific integrase [unclassified Polaromonas]OYY33398.1 MAG: integrase [Polaromonas sp. 35-63-35]OYZ18332.1 MAG: integrase [Polaromonas sp. 16-63-31]OYZ77008.1 MAG: integrase [Polaromonas sp. 24-63-21]OZA48037.1 MAG: integrase [Polaromonas sp. 17-63-33]OZA86300.1 MAG: integrase [Polaromonas sp. 39-63-25]